MAEHDDSATPKDKLLPPPPLTYEERATPVTQAERDLQAERDAHAETRGELDEAIGHHVACNNNVMHGVKQIEDLKDQRDALAASLERVREVAERGLHWSSCYEGHWPTSGAREDTEDGRAILDATTDPAAVLRERDERVWDEGRRAEMSARRSADVLAEESGATTFGWCAPNPYTVWPEGEPPTHPIQLAEVGAPFDEELPSLACAHGFYPAIQCPDCDEGGT